MYVIDVRESVKIKRVIWWIFHLSGSLVVKRRRHFAGGQVEAVHRGFVREGLPLGDWLRCVFSESIGCHRHFTPALAAASGSMALSALVMTPR